MTNTRSIEAPLSPTRVAGGVAAGAICGGAVLLLLRQCEKIGMISGAYGIVTALGIVGGKKVVEAFTKEISTSVVLPPLIGACSAAVGFKMGCFCIEVVTDKVARQQNIFGKIATGINRVSLRMGDVNIVYLAPIAGVMNYLGTSMGDDLCGLSTIAGIATFAAVSYELLKAPSKLRNNFM